MKNVYKSYLIIGLTVLVVILLVIIILLVLNKPTFSFFNSNDKKETKEENNKNTHNVDNKVDNKVDNDSNISTDSNNGNINTNVIPDSSITNDNSTNNNSSSSNLYQNSDSLTPPPTEADVIAYFQSEESNFSSYTNQDDSSLREKAKNGFITIVDFIFYGKEIKGYTFEGLTNSAKLQVIKIALTIDNKIEEYFPNYKTIIKDKYNDIKGQLAVKYLEITASLCEKVGVDTCNQVKEDFNNMKESFGFTWSLIKELAKSGKDKIKEYYENEFRTN